MATICVSISYSSPAQAQVPAAADSFCIQACDSTVRAQRTFAEPFVETEAVAMPAALHGVAFFPRSKQVVGDVYASLPWSWFEPAVVTNIGFLAQGSAILKKLKTV